MIAALGLLAVLGAAGVTVHLAFSQTSWLKYALTVLSPLVAIAVLNARRPDLVLGVAVVAAAPFSFLSAGVAGLTLTAVDVLILAALSALLLTRTGGAPRVPARGAHRTFAVVLPIALALPVARAAHPWTYVHLVGVCLLTAYVVLEVVRRYGQRPVVLAFVAGTAVQALIAVYEFATGKPLNFYSLAGAGQYSTDYFFQYGDLLRPSAAFPDPISLGNVLALACPLVVVAITRSRSRLLSVVLLGTGLVIGLALIATLSRESWLAAVAGVVATTVLLPRRQGVVALVTSTAAVLAVLLVSIGVGGPDVTSRLQSISDPTSSQVSTASGDESRLQLQHEARVVGLANEPFGVGLGNLPPYLIAAVPGASLASHAHSTYLNLFAETGIVGAGGVVAMVATALVAAGRTRVRRRIPESAGVAGSIVAMLVFWATDYSLRYVAVAAMVSVIIGLAFSTTGRRPVRVPDA